MYAPYMHRTFGDSAAKIPFMYGSGQPYHSRKEGGGGKPRVRVVIRVKVIKEL